MNGNSAALRECVIERLELKAESDDEALRQALVRQLEMDCQSNVGSCDPALEVGVCLVAGREIRRPVSAPIERMHARQRIDDFCNRFWKLAPDDRAREFEAVREVCERFREQTTRLVALQPGLDVRVDDLESLSEPTQNLARRVCELFVLPPMERIQRRREILRTELPRTPVATVSSLKAEAASIAALCPRFLDDVTALGTQDAIARSEARKRARELKSAETWSSQTRPADSGSGSRNYWWIVVAVLFGLVRLAGTSSPSSRSDTSSASRPFSVVEMRKNFQESSGFSQDNHFQSSYDDLRNRLNGYRNSGALSRQNVDPAISQFVTDELTKRQADPERRSERIVTSMDALQSKYGLESPASRSGLRGSPTSGESPTTEAARLLNSLRDSKSSNNTRFEVVTVDSTDDLEAKVEEVRGRYQDNGNAPKILMIRPDQIATRPFNEINDLLPFVAPALIQSLDSSTSAAARQNLRRPIQVLVNACDGHVAKGREFSPRAAEALEQLRNAL
jgi:hypothetical protein